MSARGDSLNIRLRLVSGTDIPAAAYPASMLVGELKQRLAASWPVGLEARAQDWPVDVFASVSHGRALRARCGVGPAPSEAEMKIICAGRVLDNSLTLREANKAPPTGELCTWHLMIAPPAPVVRTHKEVQKAAAEDGGQPACACVVQ